MIRSKFACGGGVLSLFGGAMWLLLLTSCLSGDDGAGLYQSQKRDSESGFDLKKVNGSKVREAIQGGEATLNYPWAVAVDTSGGRCSGTLIGPNLVLTARHCISYSTPRPSRCDDAQVGFFYPSVRPKTVFVIAAPNRVDGQKRAVQEILVPEVNNRCGGDIALLILTESIPDSVATPATPAVQHSLGDEMVFHSTIAAIGYGVTSPNSDDDSDIRRIRKNVGIICLFGARPDVLDCRDERALGAHANIISEGEFIGTNGPCLGDSGGGAYDQETIDTPNPIVYGVVSRGPVTEGKCQYPVYTRTDFHKMFIMNAAILAADLGHYPRPDWAKEAIDAARLSGDAGDSGQAKEADARGPELLKDGGLGLDGSEKSDLGVSISSSSDAFFGADDAKKEELSQDQNSDTSHCSIGWGQGLPQSSRSAWAYLFFLTMMGLRKMRRGNI